MIVTIKDRATLLRIHPARVGAYLRTKGWTIVAHEAGRYSLWTKPSDSEAEILLPLDSKFGDFAERMAELLTDLQRIEQRSQLEIVRDIDASSCDVFRFRKDPRSAFSGTIPIEAGARFVNYVRDMLLFAASAEYEPNRFTVSRRSEDVVRFMSNALLGQTEISSFVITAQVPVPGRLNDELFPEAVSPALEPFERRAGVRLMNVLCDTREAALEAAQTNDLQPFSDLLRRGATLNLYSALVETQEFVPGEALQVRCAWAASRPPVGPPPPKVVTFEPEIILPIKSAVEALRKRTPREGERIYGMVELLAQSAQETLIGELAVSTLIDGRPRKVRLSLQQPEYGQAIAAFGDKRPIEVRGDLVKEGKHWTLKNPRNLVVYPGEGTPIDEEDSGT